MQDIFTGIPVDLKSAMGLAGIVFVTVFGMKFAFREWATGKEAKIALAAGLVASFAAFASGMADYGTGVSAIVMAVVNGVIAGVGGQILHDKGWNALIGKDTAPTK